ncbi:MAG: hypothetical protein JWO08_491 [Verrucomicrobiaceae bacterium]|nr:hypothetical protein [Verrucomicrobiaceae bacterium]
MPMTMRPFPVLLGLAALCLALPATTQAQGTTGVTTFDPAKFPGYVVDEVVVPVPSEIFSVLDKLGEPNWHQELRGAKMPEMTDRVSLSFVFGTVVAEGFVAVQARDRKAVEDIGREVIDLSQSLSIKKAVLNHAQAILDAADKNQWADIRKQFDSTQKTVRETMDKQKDTELSQCVSLGGWLRGTATVTSIVGKNYSADRAELLYQPDLVKHFRSQTGKMLSGKKKHPLIKAVDAGLKEIQEIMEKSSEGFKVESVTRIGVISNDLLKQITNR